MKRRTIMIFPEFENMDIINNIRKKYDPLACHVRPHITLVFTFQSDINKDELKKHLDNVLLNVKGFELSLCNIVKVDNPLGKYLFLDIKRGNREISEISQKLYTGILEKYKPDWYSAETFMPHMTVGNFDSSNKLDRAYDDVKSISESFNTMVNKISVEIIDKNEDSIIEMETKLKER